MKATKIDTNGKENGKVELPDQFNENIREDVIKKAYYIEKSNSKQPTGAKPHAGLRASADISRRRQRYRGAYGYGISRVPRKIITRRGTRFYWVGAQSPGTVGGRRAHPPKAEKNNSRNINKKERKLCVRSALSASLDKESVDNRGHRTPDNYPFVLSADAENIGKTTELKKMLENAGLKEELERVSEKRIRPGKGHNRGRKYKQRRGPLIVVSGDCELKRVDNLPGVNVVDVKSINIKELAPGSQPGRMTLFTENAIKEIKEKGAFM